MSVELRIDGPHPSFAQLAAACRKEKADMRRRIVGAIARQARGLRTSIPAAAARLPSGYAPVMAGSVTVSQSVRLSVGVVSMTVSAKGRKEKRAVSAINAGVLRHPVYGNRSRWVAQGVRPGFVSDPWEQAKDAITDAVGDELAGITRRIARGS